MTTKLHNPHDAAFKSAMADVRVAREFFEQYLPESIQDIVDLSVLKLQSGSFMDEELKHTATDLLYRTQFRFCEETEPGYIYLVAEQQTSPDRWLPLRLLRYLCSVLERHRQQHPKEKELPLVVPLIFYTGQGLFPYATDVFQLFGEHAGLANNLLTGPYPLVQLSQLSDETIYTHKWTGLLELLMKHARQRDTLALIKDITRAFIQPLLAEPNTDKYIISMLNYTLDQGEVKNLDLFFELIQQELPKQVEKSVMTIAEQLREQGIQKGIQQGMAIAQQWKEEGMQKGIQKGEAAILKRQLQRRFGNIPSIYDRRIAQANDQDLLSWGENVLDAKTIEEVFS